MAETVYRDVVVRLALKQAEAKVKAPDIGPATKATGKLDKAVQDANQRMEKSYEAVEEKISLSERFGLWLSFYPFNQEQYLQIVQHWLGRLQAGMGDSQALQEEALRWALSRGSRSGRVAYQFARDWAGRQALAIA